MTKLVILWLRQDLRLHDNPALIAAINSNQPIIFLYILDDTLNIGGASRWWLHHSLDALAQSLQKKGATLVLRKGAAKTILPQLVTATDADKVMWNRRYDSAGIAIDTEIKTSLGAAGVRCESFNSHLLFEPWTIKNKQGKPYQVFTRFWNHCLEQPTPPIPLAAPDQLTSVEIASDPLESWNLLPTKPDWSGGLKDTWQPGEAAALARLENFLDELVADYKEDRNRPDLTATSRLSPSLAWGEISPRVIYYETRRMMHNNSITARGGQALLSEIGWREFSYHLLFHFPDLPTAPLKSQFKNFPWAKDENLFHLWTKGLTGYPIVDAGMRELWHTGWMHNRVRMIVASFLVKDLLLSWQQGAAWFWDTLVDADIANNSASWQWVSGCGADAAPYFRIFNPILQGEKFDPNGEYVRKWIPELKDLPNELIHKPWQASTARLSVANVQLGITYPKPIIDHDKARHRALAIFHGLPKG
ncbi:cryptochrome/photolyase family protein [Candidatus Paracaedibacter symbiosus]|uniref:cryptochrome/photolyase family protein n=1 Tax=Candidatus Paracaedibacter symbiosus TaxID=244582 RepID=UPI00050941EE|nr:deoxyribodipyrimidine photo-lyase [Candidatus Paracaedibacter symbiosus]